MSPYGNLPPPLCIVWNFGGGWWFRDGGTSYPYRKPFGPPEPLHRHDSTLSRTRLELWLTCFDSGGEEVLLDVGGQDGTEAFEDVGHSDEAREILDGLLVGNVKRMVR